MFTASSLTGDKPSQYAQLAAQAQALLDGERDRIANAANLSSLVYHALPDLNWVGFYFHDGRELVVGPFQGLPACVRIPLDKGVCGTAARTRETQRVADVHDFPGHIACDAASRSELVVPLVRGGALIGKTVTTEFAHLDPGKTRNPINLAHTPGGSSSGSAAT
mgnify:CR=1 FL=1